MLVDIPGKQSNSGRLAYSFWHSNHHGQIASFFKKIVPRRVPTLHHTPVGCVCDGVDVRGHFVSLFAFVHIHNLLRIDRQVLVRIDDDTEEA